MQTLKPIIEIALIFLPVYWMLRFMQGSIGAGILRGLVLLLVGALIFLAVITKGMALDNIEWLAKGFLVFTPIYIVILFHPELRRALIRIGQKPLVGRLLKSEISAASEIVEAAIVLSKNKIGGLIAIERDVGLGSFIERGIKIEGQVSSELLVTIFWPGTPLHDGAVVIRGSDVIAAGCLFPLTERADFGRPVGTRHRAAIGITEQSDAVCVIVSEETGGISVAVEGQITHDLDRVALRKVIEELTVGTRETEEP
ncbi:MAG: TIGR00159 family protein [Planctomycetes bacterium]|nr:TIGR00159 family protein [Planctomycetota bacterium]